MVPTTLLAMVDSSVGGKVAVNLPRAKNMVGVFHQPVGVWLDTATLATLPPREYASGLAEVVKYGVIQDPDFFQYLEAQRDAVLRCSYNRLNSDYACENVHLLTDILKRDWHFEGQVQSDWGATHSTIQSNQRGTRRRGGI